MKYFIHWCGLLVLAVTLLLLSGCGSGQTDKSVAVSFANSSSSWQKNGQTIKEMLEQEGFTVDLQFADTSEQQVEQIKQQIAARPRCLVIGAVDGGALTEVLAEAKAQHIPVIAYDRLIMNTDAVSYYAAFDNEAVGEAMGEYIEARLRLKSGAGPFNMEVFAGDSADNNAHLFFSGAMKVLEPYLDRGQLVIPSGEKSFDQVNTKDWKPEHAKERMSKLLRGPDAGKHLDAIRDGQQTITIYKDPELLVAKTVRMIKAVVEGTQPDINDVKSYDNGVLVVPSYLCTPLVIDQDNLDEVK